jgi:ribosomal protein S18 acetylase RimI-like enzyme
MVSIPKVSIRKARREDVVHIVAMLADDPLGGSREQLATPLPAVYFDAFDRISRDPNIQLVVAEDSDGEVVGCLQLSILPGLSSLRASHGIMEDVRVANDCRSRGIGDQLMQWTLEDAQSKRCKMVELFTHHARIDAQRFYQRLALRQAMSACDPFQIIVDEAGLRKFGGPLRPTITTILQKYPVPRHQLAPSYSCLMHLAIFRNTSVPSP